MSKEPRLTAIVYFLLKDNHSQELADRFEKLFRNYAGRQGGGSEVELLNRFWRLQLGMLTHCDTLFEREQLADDLDNLNWEEYFKKNVLPTIVAEELPRPL